MHLSRDAHQLYPADGIHPCSSRSLPGKKVDGACVGALEGEELAVGAAGVMVAGVALGQTVSKAWMHSFNEAHQLYPADGIHPCSSRSFPTMVPLPEVGEVEAVGDVVENFEGAADGEDVGAGAIVVGEDVETGAAVVGTLVAGPVVVEAVEGAIDGATEGNRLFEASDGAEEADGAALGVLACAEAIMRTLTAVKVFDLMAVILYWGIVVVWSVVVLIL